MKKQQWVATGLLVAVVAWILVPRNASNTDAEENAAPVITAVAATEAVPDSATGFVIRAARLSAEDFIETVRVRGRTQAFRQVDVRAEQSGRIVGNPVARGSRVAAGDVLCEIAVDTREAELQEATSRRDQTQLEYNAALDLQRENLLSAVAVAQARAAFDSAAAALERARLALENTRIRAPFAGIVESRPVETGDLLERGGICATVLDDDPMLVVGLVPESEIGKVSLGATVEARVFTGQTATGTVTFLSHAADAQSRSYRLEAEIGNPGALLRDGITTEILVTAARIRAHRIPASALTLDDAGNVGVKLLDNRNQVQYARVTIVGDDPAQLEAALWVTGLPDTAVLITHGQEVVFPGQSVEADFTWSDR